MYPKVSFPFPNIYCIFDIWRGKRHHFIWMDEWRWGEMLHIIQCKSPIFQKIICSLHRCNTLFLCAWLRKFPLFIEHHGPAQGRGHRIMYLDFFPVEKVELFHSLQGVPWFKSGYIYAIYLLFIYAIYHSILSPLQQVREKTLHRERK